MQKRQTIQNVQALRGLAILGVVLLHAMSAELKYSDDRVLTDFFVFGFHGVGLFFMISGYAVAFSVADRFRQPSEILRYIYNRITRIFPGYWLFTVPALAVYLHSPEIVNTRSTVDADVLKSLLLIPQHTQPVLQVGWTLVHQMYFYLMVALFMLGPERILPALLITWGIAVGILNSIWSVSDIMRSSAWLCHISHPLTFHFIAGYAVALVIRKGYRRYAGAAITAGLILIVVAGCIQLSPVFDLYARRSWHEMMYAVPFALVLYGLVSSELTTGKSVLEGAQNIGAISFSVYLSNALVISTLGHAWSRLKRPGPVDNLAWLALMITASLVTGAIAYLLFEKPLLGITKRLGARLWKKH